MSGTRPTRDLEVENSHQQPPSEPPGGEGAEKWALGPRGPVCDEVWGVITESECRVDLSG